MYSNKRFSALSRKNDCETKKKGHLVGYYTTRYMQSMTTTHEPFLKKIIVHTRIAALCLRDFHLTQYRG